jgi:hypothetical protein
MAPPRPISPTTPLPSCPALATTQTLPASDATILGKLVFKAGFGRRRVAPQHVIGCLILLRAPSDAAGLLLLIEQTAVQSPSRTQPARLMMRFPSPISHRLNALVDLVQETGVGTTRGELVSALLRRHELISPGDLVQLLDEYETAHAARAAPPGLDVRRVLTRVHPKPGRRPRP